MVNQELANELTGLLNAYQCDGLQGAQLRKLHYLLQTVGDQVAMDLNNEKRHTDLRIEKRNQEWIRDEVFT